MTTPELIETLHDWATDVLNAHGGQSNPRAMQLETAASELSRLSKQLEQARAILGQLVEGWPNNGATINVGAEVFTQARNFLSK